MSHSMQTRSHKAVADIWPIADTPEEFIETQTASTIAQPLTTMPQPHAEDMEQIAPTHDQIVGDLVMPQRKRKGKNADGGMRKRPRLDKESTSQSQSSHPKVGDATGSFPTQTKSLATTASGLHAAKPKPEGLPPAWSEKRSAIAETLPYFKSHQSGLYTDKCRMLGMLIDEEVSVRDYFSSQVIITTTGGGRIRDKESGKMVRTKDQSDDTRGGKFFKIALEEKIPFVVIAGERNPLFPINPPHFYNVLDYFYVTDMWPESIRSGQSQFIKTYKVRLEKVDLVSRSWWRPEGANAHDAGEFEVGSYSCETAFCLTCREPSDMIFKQGWICLNKGCKQFFKITAKGNSTNIDPDQLEYHENFLRKRTRFPGVQPTVPLAPPLPLIGEDAFGTEKGFKEGIICPKCGCCIRRIKWDGWFCENPACDFKYLLPFRMVPAESIVKENETLKGKNKNKFVHESILKYKMVAGEQKLAIYFLPDEKNRGGFIGTVIRIRPTRKAFTRAGGLDELYTRLQECELPLERRPVRHAGKRVEILTSHFTANYGAPYKFGVVVKTTNGFQGAPDPIVETNVRLSWGGEMAVAATTQLVRNQNLDVRDGVLPNEFEKFNELLVLGYFEKSVISAHDDGEIELGPTVASMSLGSKSVMKFMPKMKKNLGDDVGKDQKERSPMLSLVLKHGDILVMHGAEIQKLYLHSVTNCGKHRFAMTCRHIRPETIMDQEQRERAKVDGELSEDWAAIRYDGSNDTFLSNLTGEVVTCPDSAKKGGKSQGRQDGPTNHYALSGNSATQDSPSAQTPWGLFSTSP
ncbi:uncharacterized protein F4807DRAFT_457464 [Annulohypoxylon truncatum]|uniref:uncharacterized protein n=1 Tax=Annulohypoxylon truncatum TaxID=327061 RepID=UPI002007C9CF|nr:uncharacterized protein F4807DRAFT_457464 [Annulohypoxylon truncatum]KAI1212666.1 hypothetical protein F4807DRAFT_457464 [Annulohypoxylon truncatum]